MNVERLTVPQQFEPAERDPQPRGEAAGVVERPDPRRPADVALLTPERLRALGLSRSKASFILELSARSLSHEIDFRRVIRQMRIEPKRPRGVGVFPAAEKPRTRKTAKADA